MTAPQFDATAQRGRKLLIIGILVLALLASCGIAVGGLVISMVAMQGGGEADCQPTGTPATGGATAGGSIEAQQITNAKLIDGVVTSLHLPGRATLITLTAALGESDLINIDHGDAAGPDSAGLFQQRPSQGWGTRAQVMDPTYATTSFLKGPQHDGVGGLISITGWQQADISQVIHAVQHNADPNHYTAYITRAQQMDTKAGIDLTRMTTQQAPQAAAAGAQDGSRATDTCTSPAAIGATITLGSGPCPLDKPAAKVTCDMAIRYMQTQMDNNSRAWHRWCLRLVSLAYGGLYGNIPSAYAGGQMIQAAGQMQPATTNYKAIPRGAVLWYDGSAHGNSAGHVALSIGDGLAISNDVPVNDGRVGIVPIAYFETTWHERFMGWSAPSANPHPTVNP